MRTTPKIAADVLAAGKTIAREQGKTTGEGVTELARSCLRKPAGSRNDVPVIEVKSPETRVTLEMVNALRDEGP